MSETQDPQTTTDHRTHRTAWIVGAVAAVLLVVVLVRLFEHKPTTHGGAAQVVKVAQATQGDMPVMLSELGTVTPLATVTVLPQSNQRARVLGAGCAA